MKVVIAGGGPGGLSVAVSLKNSSVIVYERMHRLGYPPHCTGIVSLATARRLGAPPEIVEAVYERTVFLNDRLAEVCSVEAKPLAVKLARPSLEEYLALEAENLGHRVLRDSQVVQYNLNRHGHSITVSVRLGSSLKSVEADWLVVATGARVWLKRRGCRRLYGLEARVTLSKRVDDNVFYTIHSTPLAPGFFAWIAPLHNGREAVVGLAGGNAGTLAERLRKLIQIVSRHFAPVDKILETRSGLILGGPPVENMLQEQVAMIGDVLCASKPFTGGGLYAISLLAKPLAEAIEKSEPSLVERVWHGLRRELLLQYFLTRVARVHDSLTAPMLRHVCRRLGECRIDFDKHTSLMKCYLSKLRMLKGMM